MAAEPSATRSVLASTRQRLQALGPARYPVVFCTVLLVLSAATIGVYRAALAWLGPPPLAATEISSKLVLDRNGRLLRPFTTPDGLWRLPVTVDEVDPRYFALLLAYEDKRFYSHDGVDGRALGRAVWQFFRYGRPVSGASTLTMQTARLLDDRPTRSYFAKFGQVLRAWQLEAMLSKRQVLELYMRLAPFGGNIEGVRAASLAYFGKEPHRLTIAEAALLVALPQSPEQRRPDRNADAAHDARDRVIDRAAGAGVITQAEADFAKQQTLRTERYNFPALAAHLSERLAGEAKEEVIRLTIDAQLQEGAEAVVARHVASAGPKLSAAAMVIDHQTGEVLAHVGSASYFDPDRNGPIDMTQAVRSPGSALKPFIYGMGFEAGHAHPETLIQDRPVRFGSYTPENFDNIFHGTVTVRQALQLSLNVPAVKMLAAIGPARLSARIRQAGFDIDVPRNLTVALGGVGLRLEDMAGLYTALARGGEPLGLQYWLTGEPLRRAAAEPLLRPSAAWYVADILRGAAPPPHSKGGGIAFKTGTSYGFRDAWAAGFDGRHVVIAWLGRPDGTPTPGLMGLTKAAPLLFDIFAQIGPERVPLPPPPAGVIEAATTALPPPLANFREPNSAPVPDTASADPPIHIAFPPDRAELELAQEKDGTRLPVAFKAEGGVLPFTWLVNGTPLQTAPHRREVFWTPQGEGFVQLSVIDAQGRVDRVTVRLR
jgi:penicillin-binding protein 1C